MFQQLFKKYGFRFLQLLNREITDSKKHVYKNIISFFVLTFDSEDAIKIMQPLEKKLLLEKELNKTKKEE